MPKFSKEQLREEMLRGEFEQAYNLRRQEVKAWRSYLSILDGTVLIGSDAHIWPGDPPTAWRAFEYFAAKLEPAAIVLDGDVLDFARISKFPAIGWEKRPEVRDELAAAKERLSHLKAFRKIWPLGNHDMRFETRLAQVAAEFQGVQGIHLKDHFPDWEPCWSLRVNDNDPAGLVVKHRFKGGVQAAFRNAQWAGRSIATGHTHILDVTPCSDYNGTHWGVQTGTLTEVGGLHVVNYTEDNPLNQQAGFVVLTWSNGVMLTPEPVYVLSESKGLVSWRGEIIHV